MPIASSFAPELVIISAGFDAAEGDPLGGCSLTPAGYSAMTHQLMSLAHGRYVSWWCVVGLQGAIAHISAVERACFQCGFVCHLSSYQALFNSCISFESFESRMANFTACVCFPA